MIAFLNGKLIRKEPTHALIDVGGVGYLVRISLHTYAKLPQTGEVFSLHTLLIVREDAHTLYGFSHENEQELFEQLISVSGIGPNTALVMLSSLSSQEIVQAIVHEDVKTIQSIKGIGLKTAQRTIIELKDKVHKMGIDSLATDRSSVTPANKVQDEALAALIVLGIPKPAAEKSIENILKRAEKDITVEELIKLALR